MTEAHGVRVQLPAFPFLIKIKYIFTNRKGYKCRKKVPFMDIELSIEVYTDKSQINLSHLETLKGLSTPYRDVTRRVISTRFNENHSIAGYFAKDFSEIPIDRNVTRTIFRGNRYFTVGELEEMSKRI